MFTQSTKTILMAAVISWPSQLSMSLISVISDTGHQYVDSIKHYLDSEQSVIFTNELQRRVVNLYGILNSFTKSIPIATCTPPILSSTKIKRKEMEQLQEFHKYPWCYWKHKCMKMMNGIEMSHGMSLILIHVHVPNL